MPEEETGTRLGQRRYVTLVVRLLVHPCEEVQGVVVDLNEDVIGQFRRLDKLPDIIRRWLIDEQLLQKEPHDDIDYDRPS